MPKKSFDELVEQAVAAPTGGERRNIAAKARTRVIQRQKKALGAPSQYSEKLAATICKELANGRTLTKICESMGITPKSVYDWLEKHPSFREAYRMAREAMSRTLIDRLIDESEVIEPDRAVAQKVKAQIYQWVAARFNPTEFSDSRRIELKGEISHKHTHELSEGQRRRIAESWLISRESEIPLIEATTSGPDIEPGVIVQEEPQREIPKRKKAAVKEKPKPAMEADEW